MLTILYSFINVSDLGGDFIKSKIKIFFILFFILNFVSCSFFSNKTEESTFKESTTQDEYKVPDSRTIVETICSDEFGGRLVGSEGNKKAEEYLTDIIKNLKLEPLFNDKYCEPYNQEVSKTYGFVQNDDVSENKEIHNLAGVIKGCDNSKAIVISAHFDHIGYQDGEIIKGALDDASGVATVIKIADSLKKKSEEKLFSRDIIITLFNGEETAQQGSKAFINDIKGKYANLYNINIDCVGGKNAGKISLNNKSEISDKLTSAMKQVFGNNNMEYSDVKLKGATGDHKSFEKAGLANIFIGQDNLKPYIHNSTDNPDTLDYDEIDKIANVICNFIQENADKDF